MTAWCVKCRTKTELVHPVEGLTKNHRKVMKGECRKCGCKLCVFIKK